MNLNNFTIKAQEVIQAAQQAAFNAGNANIETAHLMQALLDDQQGAVTFLLKKNNVNISHLQTKLQEQINGLPKVQGGDPAQNITRELNNVILRSSSYLKEFKDEFVSVEHLLLSLLHAGDNTGAFAERCRPHRKWPHRCH